MKKTAKTKDGAAWNHAPTKKFPTRASVDRAIDKELRRGRRAK